MSESALSRRLVKKLAPKLQRWDRIENSVGTGTPDVFYVGMRWPGWVELKHCHDYPKQPTTPIRFKRFTPDQVKTIEAYGQCRMGSWVLAQVAADHWLFDWTAARELAAGQPLIWWEENVHTVWKSRLDYDQLARLL